MYSTVLVCPSETQRLLDWDSVQHKLPWNVVLLLGSGFALAEGAEVLHILYCAGHAHTDILLVTFGPLMWWGILLHQKFEQQCCLVCVHL